MVSSAARPLQDQKTLVTGGSSGIGAATARAFARAGAAVGVNYRSKASAAEELVRVWRGPAPPVLTRSPKLPNPPALDL
jgi:NAD(P)-dependent dehydrogenase (short-subunit alcohol dehydrogenase family)